jgi:hypothetical protein
MKTYTDLNYVTIAEFYKIKMRKIRVLFTVNLLYTRNSFAQNKNNYKNILLLQKRL